MSTDTPTARSRRLVEVAEISRPHGVRGELRLKLRDLRLRTVERLLLQQAALHEQVERVRLRGQALADQRIGLRVLAHAAGSDKALEEIFE